MPRRPLLPSAISGPGRSTACVSTIRRETGASTCVIVRTVACDRRHGPRDLVEQGIGLGAVIHVLGGQRRGHDLAGFGIHAGVVQVRVTPKTRNPFTIKALSI